MILGCDAAGTLDDGTEVVVHAVVSTPGWTGDETLDPKRTLLSEKHDGTLAESRRGPRAQRPAQAARAVAGRTRPACRRPGSRPTGCSSPTPACGPARPSSCRAPVAASRPPRSRSPGTPATVWATSRDEDKRAQALDLGAHEVFETGARLPEQRRRGARDRRQGDLVALDEGAAPRRHPRRLRRHHRTRPERRPQPAVLPAAAGDRLDDGHPRRAEGPAGVLRQHRPAPRRQRRAAAVRRGRQLRRLADGRRLREARLTPDGLPDGAARPRRQPDPPAAGTSPGC